MTDKVHSSTQADDSLDKVRELLLGRDDKYIADKFESHAKHYVSDVVSEALLARENKDGSVNKVLVPLVEKSLHRSIEANSDKIVGTLYPLVGTLVRKAFSSFIIEFVERTNTLIENSLSPKSLSWRFKAWQSGIKYSEYVAAQIYQYQVQQLLVIHRETGTLLHNISADPHRQKDADLVSSMLVAINDFVADAFGVSQHNTENDLGEIKTDDFTLLISVGPQAILVAAVTGSVPPTLRNKLQQTLEDFHQFYQQPLLEYAGDNAPFEGCETLLSDCLVSERKSEETKKSKNLLGAIVLLLILGALIVLAFMRLSLSILKSDLQELPTTSGLTITDTYISNGRVYAKVLRDPAVISVSQWLSDNDIDSSSVVVIEEPFVSLKPSVVLTKLQNTLAQFSLSEEESLTLHSSPDISISGQVYPASASALAQQIASIPGIEQLEVSQHQLSVIPYLEIDTSTLQKAAQERLVNKISAQSVLFATNQESVSAVQLAKLEEIARDINALATLAEKTNTFISIVVLGASDNSGASARNKILSQKRAENVVSTLISFGVSSELVIAVSLGELPLKKPSMGRSVMINVLTSNAQ